MESRHAPSSPSSKLIAFAVVALACAAPSALAGCGGSSGATFQPSPPDGGSLGSQLDGSLLPTDAGLTLSEDAASCAPATVTSFKATWKPPLAFKSGACTTAQISSYYDACLGASSTSAGCASFTQSYASCAGCLQSNDTDAKYGPVIWHTSPTTYYTINIAGCIADEQGDAGSTSCASAYQAAVACKETACVSCATDPDPAGYSNCETEADSTGCLSFAEAKGTACGSELSDPNSPVAICFPPQTDSTEEAYLELAPVFCGQ